MQAASCKAEEVNQHFCFTVYFYVYGLFLWQLWLIHSANWQSEFTFHQGNGQTNLHHGVLCKYLASWHLRCLRSWVLTLNELWLSEFMRTHAWVKSGYCSFNSCMNSCTNAGLNLCMNPFLTFLTGIHDWTVMLSYREFMIVPALIHHISSMRSMIIHAPIHYILAWADAWIHVAIHAGAFALGMWRQQEGRKEGQPSLSVLLICLTVISSLNHRDATDITGRPWTPLGAQTVMGISIDIGLKGSVSRLFTL